MAQTLTQSSAQSTLKRAPLKILLISFYYPPDLSAGSFRAQALVHALQGRAQAQGIEIDIEVLTTVPNRYSEVASAEPGKEEHPGLTIHRIALPGHASGLKDQSRAFISYARQALRLAGRRKFDLVFGTSSRLMSAALASQIARRTRAPLYLDIRDIFTESMQDIFAKSLLRRGLALFRFIEQRTFRRADRISINSPEFASHIAQVAPKVGVKVFTNGIDPDFLSENFSKPDTVTASVPTLLYAGNIGEGQGLERIIPGLATRFKGRARFHIIGNGGRRTALEQALQDVPAESVKLSPAMARHDLYKSYREADALFVHLNDYPAFRKVIPSKLFEYGAIGKPILAGLAGYPAGFVTENLPESALFPPCDLDAASHALETLLQNLHHSKRPEFCRRFDRTAIMNDMADDLIQIASSGAPRP